MNMNMDTLTAFALTLTQKHDFISWDSYDEESIHLERSYGTIEIILTDEGLEVAYYSHSDLESTPTYQKVIKTMKGLRGYVADRFALR